MWFIENLYSLKAKTFAPPVLQCHRGYWVEGLQQNSLASLKKAYELGYKMAEFDIRITKDKFIILFHDDFIGTKKVSDMTLAEVESIHAVDSFESVMQWFSKIQAGQYFLNIEIKSKFVKDRTLEAKVLELILKYNMQKFVLISSFNPLSLYFFKKKCSIILRALLLTYDKQSGNNTLIRSQILNFLARPHLLHLDEKYWSEKRFKSLIKRGIPVILWTCNDRDRIKNYFLQGIYGVISDSVKPEEVKYLLKTSQDNTRV